MANPFVHVELTTSDLGQAKKFYRTLFGWKLDDMPMPGGMTYTLIDAGSGNVGGGMQAKPMPNAPTTWLSYVLVDDVKKSIATARKHGASIVVDYQEVMDRGAFGIFVDPAGAMLGLWQSFDHPTKPAAAKKKNATAKQSLAKKAAAKKSTAKKSPAKKAAKKAVKRRA